VVLVAVVEQVEAGVVEEIVPKEGEDLIVTALVI